MKKFAFSILFLTIGLLSLHAQKTGRMAIDGQIVQFMIDEQGDTLIMAELDDISVSSPRHFNSREEYRRYNMYKRYALKVYPYANEAIRIYREVEEETDGFKKRQRKKFAKQKHKELKEQFEDPLRKLTKTQGKILVKMIEKELNTPMYKVIKSLRGSMTASYWNTLSKVYGHRLRDGYIPKEDPLMDIILTDLDISYDKK